MPRIEPLPIESLPEYQDIFQGMVDSIGYVPNSFLTMARDPLLIKAVGAMSDAAWYSTAVSEKLRRLVTYSYSQFSRSFYSSAHCACGAPELGLSLEKILAINDYETSELFDDAERALLRVCRHAARIPGEVTDADMAELALHYSQEERLTIVSMICFMAYLNKWNEIVGTTLEDIPEQWAREHLEPVGWRSAKPE